MTTKIVPHRCYRHPDGGPSVSLFTSYVPPGYVLVTAGFTTQNADGTYGTGNVPFKTAEEGEAWLARFKARTGRDFEGMAGFTR